MNNNQILHFLYRILRKIQDPDPDEHDFQHLNTVCPQNTSLVKFFTNIRSIVLREIANRRTENRQTE